MKKEKKQKLSLSEAVTKRLTLVRELAKYRLTLDAANLASFGGLSGIEREIKSLSRIIAVGK